MSQPSLKNSMQKLDLKSKSYNLPLASTMAPDGS